MASSVETGNTGVKLIRQAAAAAVAAAAKWLAEYRAINRKS